MLDPGQEEHCLGGVLQDGRWGCLFFFFFFLFFFFFFFSFFLFSFSFFKLWGILGPPHHVTGCAGHRGQAREYF